MQQYNLSTGRIAFLNIQHKKSRTLRMAALVAVLSFTLFGGLILTDSLQNGLKSISSHLGADLIVVPEGSDESMEGILLQGKPGFFYFDKSVEESILDIQGVAKTSAQFYLTSVAADCCDLPVEIIGFDPDTDFAIQPWISETYSSKLGDNELIIGSDITAFENSTVRLYNTKFKVVARLMKTGTGLDQAVYGNWNTLMSIFETAKEQGLGDIPDRNPEKSISSVLVKLEDGYSAEDVAQAISQEIDGVTVVKMEGMLGSIASELQIITVLLRMFVVLLVLVSLFALSVIFSVTAGERKKEFALLRSIGFTRKKLSALLLTESFFVSAAGGIIGVAAAAIVVFPFNSAIGEALEMPYLQPGWATVVGVLVISLMISFAVGPLAAMRTVVKIGKEETYMAMREGEV
jgi:putative ABC transport system permease protein